MSLDKKLNRGNIYSIALIFFLLIALVVVGRLKAAILFYNQGAKYYNRGLYTKAEASFKCSLILNARAAITHNTLGSVYVKLGQDEKAIDAYQKAIKFDPRRVKAYIALSDIYLEREDYEQSIDELKRAREMAAEDDPEIKTALEFVFFEYMSDCLNKGVNAFLAGDKQKAFSLVRTALSVRPDFAYSHYTLAYFYYTDAIFTEAETELREAIRLNPEFYFSYKLLGDIYFKRQEYEKVIGVYQDALVRNPESSVLENDLGLAFMQLERYEEAIPHLKEALRLDPGNSNIRYSLASVYRDSKRYDEAVNEYSRLLADKGEFPNVHNDLGDIYVVRKENERAAAEYSKEIEYAQARLSSYPRDIIALVNLARAYNGLGKTGQAKEMVDRAIVFDPGFREAYLTLGRIYEKEGKFNESLAAFNKAKELSLETNFIDRDITRVKDEIPDENTAVISDIRPPDVLFLKNGRQIQGKIVMDSDEKIVLEVNMGGPRTEVTFYRGEISHIVKGGLK
ncbi:MAG: tetratricopeptide repeat protein [Candidatus Omnitrophota bacterium]